MLSTAIGSKEHGDCVRGLSSKLSIEDGFEKDKARYRSHDRYKEEIVAAAENAMQTKFKDMLRAALAEQEVGQQQLVVVAPPVIGRASSACAQSSAASNTTLPYPVDAITSITPCLLLYPVGRAGKTKEAARARVHPAGSLFEGNPTPALYACVEVEELL